ncbi:MAG: acetoacetate--CoA ligase [Alphaproteobacteria bacterium]
MAKPMGAKPMGTEPLWRPSASRIGAANATRFLRHVREEWGAGVPDFAGLWAWSVSEPEKFWQSVWSFCGVLAETRGERVLTNGHDIIEARFFPDARLNFARNLLRKRGPGDAMVFWGEGKVRRRVSHDDLYRAVHGMHAALKARGLKAGDRIAAIMPNMPETVTAMLGAASLGAIWSSCSPDFGARGVLDRFSQIEPSVLIAADGYFYNGKAFGCLDKIREVAASLPSVKTVVVVPYTEDRPRISDIPGAVLFEDFIGPGSDDEIAFAELPFDHPLYILFSSGTTGVPKCIVHGAGGTLLQHLKEHQLHCDIKPGDRVFYFTTCSWMMWNWLVSALASEATLLLYDGSPFHPDGNVLFDYADAEGMSLFGTSAKYIDAVLKEGLKPAATHELSKLRTVTSTGSPLSPEGFRFVYEGIKKDVCLSSIAGGTDIVSCFVLGNPIGPVYEGEIQSRGLGMKVDVFDKEGRPVRGRKGELVCTAPFPSRPIGFWNDPEKRKYRAAYFEVFPNVWHHGDFVELTDHDGMIIYGRSDATLNPGGVRIGTAEIYREVERMPEVLESLAVGQDWDNDVRVVLFVRLREGIALDDGLSDRIKKAIRTGCSPRHVPARIVQVSDIPRTKSGKIVELAVREVIHGRPVKNIEALANPEALAFYKDLPQLKA